LSELIDARGQWTRSEREGRTIRARPVRALVGTGAQSAERSSALVVGIQRSLVEGPSAPRPPIARFEVDSVEGRVLAPRLAVEPRVPCRGGATELPPAAGARPHVRVADGRALAEGLSLLTQAAATALDHDDPRPPARSEASRDRQTRRPRADHADIRV